MYLPTNWGPQFRAQNWRPKRPPGGLAPRAGPALDSRSRCQFVGRSASINSAAAENLNCWLESETWTTRQSDANINKLKLHAVRRPTWTSEGKRRSSLNLVAL